MMTSQGDMAVVPWERAGGTEFALLHCAEFRDLMSQSQARAFVTNLMHDVSAISCDFGDDAFVFEKCFEVSLLDSSSSEFYGLYVAYGDLDCCYALRQVTWSGDFRSAFKIQSDIRGDTIFFRASRIEHEISESLQWFTTEEVELGAIEKTHEERAFSENALFTFFSCDNNGRSLRSFRPRYRRNEIVEVKFEEFRRIKNALSDGHLMQPKRGSQRVKYLSDWYRRLASLTPVSTSGS